MNSGIKNLRNPRHLWFPPFFRSPIAILIFLTLIAAGLRFTAIDRPTIWGDEVATYGRVAGSWGNLLTGLSDHSVFTPLHYELYWWIAQGMPYWGKVTDHDFEPTHRLIAGGIELTPLVMRLIPAIAGTLMVPAIYFLSRQLFGPRVSLLAAFFCCFSAYLLVYSRDAKMYMHFWLACTLNMGCFLWWVRRRSLTAWLCWILTGMIMIGLHALGRALLGVEAFIALTAPGQYPFRAVAVLMSPRGQQPWRRLRLPLLLMFAVGAVAIYWPTKIYYDEFNKHIDNVIADGEPLDTGEAGIHWVAIYNGGRSFGDLVLFASSAFLTSWEWPQKAPELTVNAQIAVNPLVLKLLQGSTVALLCLLATGLVPWRRFTRPAQARLDDLPQDSQVLRAFSRRRAMWLGVWVCAIGFAFYATAARRPAFVLDGVSAIALKSPPAIIWPRLPLKPAEIDSVDFYTSSEMWSEFARHWPAVWEEFCSAFTRENLAVTRLVIIGVVALALLAAVAIRIRWVWRGTLRLTDAVGIVLLICAAIAVLPQFASSSIWMPRYLGVTFPAIAIIVAALIARQPARWMQIATLLLIVVVNMSEFGARVFGHTEPPVDRMARDVINAQPQSVIAANAAVPSFRAYTFMGAAQGPDPGKGTLFTGPGSYYLRLYAGIPSEPRTVRIGQYHTQLKLWPFDGVERIARDLERSPQIERFVVWSATIDHDLRPTDLLAMRLKGKFRRVAEEYIPAYDHWTWRKTYTLVRREYVVVK